MTRRWILVLAAALVASMGVFLMVRAAEGQIAMDFLAAVERGDLEAAAGYVGTFDDRPSIAAGPAPDWAWHPEEIVDVSPDDSYADYDVTVAVSALVAGRRLTAEVHFTIGETRRDGEIIVDPRTRSTVAVEQGPMVISVAGTSHRLDSGDEELGIDLLPGVYMVTGVHPETLGGTRGFLPVPPPSWDEPGLVLAAP